MESECINRNDVPLRQLAVLEGGDTVNHEPNSDSTAQGEDGEVHNVLPNDTVASNS